MIMLVITPIQVQRLAPDLAEFHSIFTGTPLRPVKSFWGTFLLPSMSTAPLSLVLSKRAEGLIPLSVLPPKMSNRCEIGSEAVVAPDGIPGFCANCIASFFLVAFAKF